MLHLREGGMDGMYRRLLVLPSAIPGMPAESSGLPVCLPFDHLPRDNETSPEVPGACLHVIMRHQLRSSRVQDLSR